ncbi:MAG: FAD-binding protein [Candidatus Gastranaerophilaceae bacterium]
MYNVAIIGAGPAGIFAALEITKLKPDWNVVLIEKGQRIEKENACFVKAMINVPLVKNADFFAAGAEPELFLTEN